MKAINRILAALTVATALTVFSASTSVSKAETYTVAFEDGTGGVYNQQVVDYLTAFGYERINVKEILSDGDRICTAFDPVGIPVLILVDVNQGQIVGHEESGGN